MHCKTLQPNLVFLLILQISTKKLLTLKVADNQKDFPMYLVSDAAPTEQDVAKYASMQKNYRKDVLTKRQANKLRRKQDELVNNYTYTTEDIEKNLQERKKQGKTFANRGLEQTKAGFAVQGAKDTLQEAKRVLTEAKRELDRGGAGADTRDLEKAVLEAQNRVKTAEEELKQRKDEDQAIKDQVKDRKRRLAQRSKDKNWAKVNQRNITVNQRADFEESQKQKEVQAKKTAAEANRFNPFARRKVKPKILWKVGQNDEQEGAKDSKNVEEEKKDNREANDKDLAEVTPSLVHEDKADLVNQSHQFTIDEEVLAQSGSNGFSRLSSTKRPQKKRVRKGISLNDYLDRKANGTL